MGIGPKANMLFALYIVAAVAASCVCPCFAEETDDYIHYHLGVKYKSENKYDQALDEFRKLLTAYPDNYNAYMQVAEIRKLQNQPRLVIFNLKKALSYNPGWGKAEKMLAEAYEQDKQYQNSIIEYQHYQQSCDPAELDSIQTRINKLVRKVKGEPEPAVEEPAAAAPAPKDTVSKDTTLKTAQKEKAAPQPKKSAQATKASSPSKEMPKTPTLANSSAEECFQQAVALYNQGKYNEALPFLKKAVTLDRGYSAAYYYGGLVRYKLGQTDLAKVNFTKAFSYPEGAGPAHFYLGKILGTEKNYKEGIANLNEYLETASEGDMKREAVTLLEHYKAVVGDKTPLPAGAKEPGEDEKPVEKPQSQLEAVAAESVSVTVEMRIDSLLTMAVADTLTDAGHAMLAGVKEFMAAHYDNAIKEFKKVSVSYPAVKVAAPCLYDIGICYMKLRIFTNAENQFSQLLERFPMHTLAPQSMFFKAYCYFERRETSQAEKLFREFIQKHRSHPWASKAFEKLGDIYSDLHEPGKAIDAYLQASANAVKPADKQYALFKLAGSYNDASNVSRSLETYKKIIDNGEKTNTVIRVPDAYYRIADKKYQQKEFPQALELYQKVTRKYPTYQETPWGLFQIGNIYKNTKEYQKSIDAYKNLEKTYPDDYWSKQAKWKMEDAVWENEYNGVLE